MAQTRVSFSQIGITSAGLPKRQVLHYPVLWILNPSTGRCKRHDHLELKDEINKSNYQGLAEAADFVLVITKSSYYSFSSNDGNLIIKSLRSDISGDIIGVQAEGVLFRDKNFLVLRDKELKEVCKRELTKDELEELDK